MAKLYKVSDRDGGNFMGYQLWTSMQIRSYLYGMAKREWGLDRPHWPLFTLDYCSEMWNIEIEEQKDLK